MTTMTDKGSEQIKDLLKDHSIQHGCQALHNIGGHQHINMFFQMPFGILKYDREGETTTRSETVL